jgi:ligand-binding SRPBCC domain-containing protein
LSRTYTLKTVQQIPVSLQEAWDFFSRPDNLALITPASMRFVIRGRSAGEKMYPGQLIEYTVRPLFSIPVYWLTEITHVTEPVYFVDEQRYGPYSMWHHQHHFREIAGGVEMTDIVTYKIPFWFIGDLANALFVKKKLQEIFRFRKEAVEKKFGSYHQKEQE